MRDIAITGVGVVSALGCSTDAFWRGLTDGVLALRPVPEEPPGPGPRWWSPVAADFDLAAFVSDPKRIRQADRFVQYALASAVQAVADAGLALPPERTAVVLGTTMGGLPGLVQAQQQYDREGADAVSARLMATVIPNMASAHVAMHLGLHGPQLTVASACASSIDAIGMAAMLIERGTADAAVAGGMENFLHLLPYYSLAHARAVSRATDPRVASRPFDRAREGFIVGEGGAAVVLERAQLARERGARIWGELRGYGSLADGHHVTSPEPSGRWEAAAMRAALADAGLGPGQIDAVVAHGTATPVGDAAEIRALNQVFDGGQAPPVTSIKGHIGHSMGASGVMSLIAGLYAMREGRLPPTLGTTEPDPVANFPVVTGGPMACTIGAFQVNAFGFGGQNASLVVTRQER